jgi:hypothetical protein
MSAGHGLRRENYTFPRFDPRFDAPLPTTSLVPGPFAVIVTVALAATFSFLAMDASAAAWFRHELVTLWMLLTA